MFPQLEQGLNITLTIIISIIIAWFVLLFVNLAFFFFFRTILKKHAKAMTVILNAKYENTKKLFDLMKTYEVEVEEKVITALNGINPKTFNNHDDKDAEETRAVLAYLKDEANFIANRNKDKLDKADFQLAKANVLELDSQYRNNVVMYNADVLGYNYWITFLPCRFIFKICRVKKKKIIG